MYYFYTVALSLSVCVADLYQVNKTRTKCYDYVAEFICSQHDSLLTWTVRSITSGERSATLSFNSQFNTGDNMIHTSVDSTQVTAELILGKSTFSLARLTIEADLQILCAMKKALYIFTLKVRSK